MSSRQETSEKLQLRNVWGLFAEVGQLHIVAKDMAQVSIGITWNRKIIPLKLVGGQWKNLVGITGIVEGNAHAAGDDL